MECYVGSTFPSGGIRNLPHWVWRPLRTQLAVLSPGFPPGLPARMVGVRVFCKDLNPISSQTPPGPPPAVLIVLGPGKQQSRLAWAGGRSHRQREYNQVSGLTAYHKTALAPVFGFLFAQQASRLLEPLFVKFVRGDRLFPSSVCDVFFQHIDKSRNSLLIYVVGQKLARIEVYSSATL